MKRWGKSPPRLRQRRRHGKPRRVQGQVRRGAASRGPGVSAPGPPWWTARTSGRPGVQMNGRPRVFGPWTEPGLQAVRTLYSQPFLVENVPMPRSCRLGRIGAGAWARAVKYRCAARIGCVRRTRLWSASHRIFALGGGAGAFVRVSCVLGNRRADPHASDALPHPLTSALIAWAFIGPSSQ